MRHILLALVLLLPISGNAWAWGDQGHKVIWEIVLHLVQPNTRAVIEKLISTDERLNGLRNGAKGNQTDLAGMRRVMDVFDEELGKRNPLLNDARAAHQFRSPSSIRSARTRRASSRS